MAFARRLFAAALFCAATTPAAASDYTLTTLEWPPFVGADLPQGGASAAVVRAAYAAVGAEVEIVFAPWQRAVSLAREGEQAVAAVFPEYARADDDWSVCSPSIGTSPLGFAENVESPVAWATLEDLKPFHIGVVDGYANTDAFDAMMAAGDLKTDGAPDDVANLRKVAAGRLDLAVVDQNVMRHLAAADPKIDGDRIRFNAQPLEMKTLHVCFGRHAAGEAARGAFLRGLEQIDPEAVMADYFAAAQGS